MGKSSDSKNPLFYKLKKPALFMVDHKGKELLTITARREVCEARVYDFRRSFCCFSCCFMYY